MSEGAAAPAPGSRALGDQLLRNTVYGVFGRIAGLLVTFFLTPFIVARLGAPQYALYSLGAALTGYLGLLDLGLGTGYVKFVAEAAERRDVAGVNTVLATGLWTHLVFGAGMLLLWREAGGAVVRLLGIPAGLSALAHEAFTVAVLMLALSGAAAAFRSVLYGLQRIDLATRIGVALILPRLIAILLVLRAGGGVLGLLWVDLLLFLLGSAGMAWSAFRLYPGLSLGPGRWSGEHLRRLLRYGLPLQVSRLSELVSFQLDKILLARFVGLRSVAEYDLGTRVLSTGRSLPLLLVSAVVPAVSALDARGASSDIDRVARRGLRYLLLFATPLFAFLALEADRFTAVWLGPGHAGAALTIRLLALGYLLNVASGAFTSVTQGLGRNAYQLEVTLVALGLNLTLSLALVRPFGLLGVLTGTCCSLVVSYAWAAWRFGALARREFAAGEGGGWRAHRGVLLGGFAASFALLGLHAASGPLEGRLAGALWILGDAAAFLSTYLGALWLSGDVDPQDREIARRTLALLRRPRG